MLQRTSVLLEGIDKRRLPLHLLSIMEEQQLLTILLNTNSQANQLFGQHLLMEFLQILLRLLQVLQTDFPTISESQQ